MLGKYSPGCAFKFRHHSATENAPCGLFSGFRCLWHTGGKLLAIPPCKLGQALEPVAHRSRPAAGCQQSGDLAPLLTDFIWAHFTPTSRFDSVPRRPWPSLEALLFIQLLAVCCAGSWRHRPVWGLGFPSSAPDSFLHLDNAKPGDQHC